MSNRQDHPDRDVRRRRAALMAKNRAFTALCWGTAGISVVVLGVLLVSIVAQGVDHLSSDFISNPPSRKPQSAGLGPAMWGTIWVCSVCAVTALPLGVGTAIFLEEYKPKNRFVHKLHGLVQLNIANLAGVPSIVYGIIGLTVFVQMFGALGNPNEPKYTIGQQWFDTFAMVDGSLAHVRVDGKDVPPVVATPHVMYTDDDGSPLTVRLVPEVETLPILNAIEDRMAAVKDAIVDRIEHNDTYTNGHIAVVVDDAFDEAGLKLDRTAIRSQVIAELIDLNGVSDRDVRWGMRTIMSNIKAEESRTELPNVLVIGTEPTRIDRKSFYYMQFPFGRGVLAVGLTLMLVILPIVIISAQEALRAVPNSLREGAQGLGATRWQMVSRMTLPAAIPGIMTGSILAMSRAIGEAAPILIIAGIVFIRFAPQHLMDEVTAMPLQIYDWAGRPQEAFHHVAASGIIVLLAVLLTFNAAAVFIRQRFQNRLR